MYNAWPLPSRRQILTIGARRQGDANATDAYNTAVNAFLQAANRHNPDGAFLASLHLVDAKGVIKKLKFSKAQVASHTLNLFYYGLAYGSAIAADGLCTSTGNDNQAQIQKIYIYCSLAVVRGMKSDSATVDKAKFNLSPADVQKLDAQVAAFDADPAKMEKWLRAGEPAIGAPAAKGTDGGSGGVAEAPGAPSNDLITGLFRETVHSISARVARGNKESRDLTKDLDIFGSARENLDNAMVNKINSLADNTVLSVRRKVNYEGVWNVEVGYRFRGTDQTGMFKMLMRQEGGRWICHLPDLERVTGVNLPTLDQLMQPAH